MSVKRLFPLSITSLHFDICALWPLAVGETIVVSGYLRLGTEYVKIKKRLF